MQIKQSTETLQEQRSKREKRNLRGLLKSTSRGLFLIAIGSVVPALQGQERIGSVPLTLGNPPQYQSGFNAPSEPQPTLAPPTATLPSAIVTNDSESPIEPYWTQEGRRPQKTEQGRAAFAELETLIWEAMKQSPYIQGILVTPRIREMEAQQAEGVFDPTRFANSIWSDRSDPVGSTLATGGPPRLDETNLQNSVGIRKKNRIGGNLEASQDLSLKNNNSLFFQPNDQADTKLLLRYTQPLMKGAGKAYNQSSVCIAKIQVGVSQHEVQRLMQTHAIDITQLYWQLYLYRAQILQFDRGIDRLQRIAYQIEGRTDLDAVRSQLMRARAAVENHRARRARSIADVSQTEAALRAKVNADWIHLGLCDEIVPITEPVRVYVPIDPSTHLDTALGYRPDILRVRDEIKAANVRLKVAENELKPTLNMVTDLYVRGLNGQFDAAQSFADQFTTGRASYSGGLEYLRPKNQIVANAIRRQRSLEIQQLLHQLETVLLEVSSEIASAIADVQASYTELIASQQSTMATKVEVEQLEARWIKSAFLEPTQVSQNLDQLLDAEIRLISAEGGWASSQAQYMLSLAKLRYATGELLSATPE